MGDNAGPQASVNKQAGTASKLCTNPHQQTGGASDLPAEKQQPDTGYRPQVCSCKPVLVKARFSYVADLCSSCCCGTFRIVHLLVHACTHKHQAMNAFQGHTDTPDCTETSGSSVAFACSTTLGTAILPTDTHETR